MKVKVKKNKNEEIYEESNDGENPDSEDNERNESESEELSFSKTTKKKGDADELVDTKSDTDMSKTNNIVHSDSC